MSKFAWYAEDKNAKQYLKEDPKKDTRNNWICLIVISLCMIAPFCDAVVTAAAR